MPYLRSKVTGQTVYVPDGQGGRAPNQIKVRGEMADIANTGANTTRTVTQTVGDQISNRVADATANATIRKAAAEADKAEADAATAKSSASGVTPEIRQQLNGKMAALRNLNSILTNLEGQYKKNFKGRPLSRVFGLTELIPGFASEANENFNKTALRAGPFIQSILGLGAKDADAAAEYERKVMPFIPKSNDFDVTTEGKLKDLRSFYDAQMASVNRQLGIKALPRVKAAQAQRSRSKVIKFSDLPE